MNDGIDHVGISVPDIEKATAFLIEAFDATVLYESHSRNDAPIELIGIENTLNAIKGTKIFAVRMISLKNGPDIELFEIYAPTQAAPIKTSDLGLQHLALYTTNIQKAMKKFVSAGGILLTDAKPMMFPAEKGSKNLFCYCLTPWGTTIELISYPNSMAYEKKTKLRRWKGGGQP
jgi:catechol 2,3-dioxygenase-like lactoylglutathione lyase family enzyme